MLVMREKREWGQGADNKVNEFIYHSGYFTEEKFSLCKDGSEVYSVSGWAANQKAEDQDLNSVVYR